MQRRDLAAPAGISAGQKCRIIARKSAAGSNAKAQKLHVSARGPMCGGNALQGPMPGLCRSSKQSRRRKPSAAGAGVPVAGASCTPRAGPGSVLEICSSASCNSKRIEGTAGELPSAEPARGRRVCRKSSEIAKTSAIIPGTGHMLLVISRIAH